MGAWNFIVDMSQEGRLGDHQERIEELEEKVEILHEWVLYLRKQLEEKQNDSSTGL